MEHNLHTYIRFRVIDQFLRQKGRAVLSEITAHCKNFTGDELLDDVSIASDLKAMNTTPPAGLGAPVVLDETTGEYYYRDKDFGLDRTPLSEEETLLMNDSLKYLSLLAGHESLKGLKGILQKITNILMMGNPAVNGKLPDFVQAELPASSGGSQFLSPIIQAIKSQKVMRIYYQPFYEDKPYFTLVHPYLLKEYESRWYLVGLNEDKQKIRTYALDRIRGTESTSLDYRKGHFNANLYFRDTIGIIAPEGDPPDIRISVLRHQANYLITKPLHESQYIEDENENTVIFNYKVHPTYEFKARILSMGADAVLLSPQSLRIEILKILNDAILGYGDPV